MFGLITLRSAPVEACIAISIVLVASEALRDRETLARRLPALVSFLFGLVHGLGFAGALKDIGLPESHLPLALLTFNVGVELGQLAMVLLAFVLVRLPLPDRYFVLARRPALYAVGAARRLLVLGADGGHRALSALLTRACRRAPKVMRFRRDGCDEIGSRKGRSQEAEWSAQRSTRTKWPAPLPVGRPPLRRRRSSASAIGIRIRTFRAP